MGVLSISNNGDHNESACVEPIDENRIDALGGQSIGTKECMEIIGREDVNENLVKISETPPPTEDADAMVKQAKMRDGIARKEPDRAEDQEITIPESPPPENCLQTPPEP